MASALAWCISDWPNSVVERTAHPTCLLGFAHIVEGGPPLTTGIDMIDIANGCAKRTYTSDFWRNRCVNHPYFLICTQGKSEGLGAKGAEEKSQRESSFYVRERLDYSACVGGTRVRRGFS